MVYFNCKIVIMFIPNKQMTMTTFRCAEVMPKFMYFLIIVDIWCELSRKTFFCFLNFNMIF